jgi:hypothetical protein
MGASFADDGVARWHAAVMASHVEATELMDERYEVTWFGIF